MSNTITGCPFSIGLNGNTNIQNLAENSRNSNFTETSAIPEPGTAMCPRNNVSETVQTHDITTIINSNNATSGKETTHCEYSRTRTIVRNASCGQEANPASNEGSPTRKTSNISCVSSSGGSDETEGEKKLDLRGLIESIGTLLIPVVCKHVPHFTIIS